MSEKNMWKNVRKKMVPQFWAEATRHEDAYQRGIADVSFVQNGLHGWMELKYRAVAPVRPSTICKINHYTDDQRIWLRHKGNAGGMTFLLLQLGRSYMLFDHVQCQEVGRVTTSELIDLSCWYSIDRLNAHELWNAINEQS
jgi:hypothetical protein